MGLLKLHSTSNSDLTRLEIVGARVLLRPVSRDFAADIFAEFSAQITRYMFPKPAENIKEIHLFIDESRLKLELQNDIVFAITDKTSGEFLGICGLHGKADHDVPELGIWLKRSAHGKKLGREAIKVLVQWVATNMATSTIKYPVDKRNIPSCKIAESLGGVIIAEDLRQSQSGNTLQEVVYQIDVRSST